MVLYLKCYKNHLDMFYSHLICHRIKAKHSSDVQSATQDVIYHISNALGSSDYFLVQSSTMDVWYDSMICVMISIAVLSHKNNCDDQF